jgi:hypothetical protein
MYKKFFALNIQELAAVCAFARLTLISLGG